MVGLTFGISLSRFMHFMDNPFLFSSGGLLRNDATNPCSELPTWPESIRSVRFSRDVSDPPDFPTRGQRQLPDESHSHRHLVNRQGFPTPADQITGDE